MQPGIMKTVFSLKMVMIRLSAFILIMLIGATGIRAQDYNHAFKVQTSFGYGLSYKMIDSNEKGFDGYVGLEYRFLKIPFNIVVDLNCNFEFFRPGYFGINFIPTAGLAYVFKDKRNH